jgi:hypothetical protein
MQVAVDFSTWLGVIADRCRVPTSLQLITATVGRRHRESG